ncbi:hypothetical protein [Chondromyces apiculatus]|uniref:Transmembrane protein (PGPGW) n=1 Tax=Chondromyces apiculatus DSM 436 TaxID=1192034 RepID=A0A017T034_9BACT|nr:hypothetical protein [Chondromyces apiculatus]EYF02548.1 Hypothetical protein CAP_6755 [Chondromyces apiculatus DSM 436]
MDKINEWLAYASAHRTQIALGAGIFVGSILLSLGVVTLVLVKLPADYLESEEEPFMAGRPAGVQILARVGRNLLGLALVALGVVLSLPGIPGQGILTILIGIMFLDIIPGKRKLERKILGQKKVLASVNKLRARFHKPPLEAKDD